MNSIGIQVGVSKASIQEAKKSILEILNCHHADEKTKRVALKMLNSICNIGNVAMNNCHVDMK